MRLAFAPYLLHFKEPGGTSRGVLTEKPTFLIKVYDENDPARFGSGEAAVFPGLSPEADGN
ncbi:MAG: o-succinylbenzoate synthase, partial [Muribaculaceae bacterium]|nr:o-succinylbenzoate synthase [Muribaculaceae bacterium]